jgi:CHRD domain
MRIGIMEPSSHRDRAITRHDLPEPHGIVHALVDVQSLFTLGETIMLRHQFVLLALAAAASLVGSASAATITLPINMNGSVEFPGPGDPDGSATGTMTFDTTTNTISWNITYTGIATPLTGFHIHPGAVGTSGGILVGLGTTTSGGPGTLISSTTTTAANIATILANPTGHYANIHNGPFGGGALRGQLPKQYNVKLIGNQEVPGPGDPDGHGTGTVSLNPGPPTVHWNLTYTNLDTVTDAHIHTGAAGVGGPPLIGFGPGTTGGPGTLIGSTTPTAAQVNTVLTNPTGHYVNIHTTAFGPGAIRGQVKRLGDVDGDGDTDGLDLAALLGVWTGAASYAPCPPIQSADIDGNCKVNGLDLAAVLADWAPVP